MPKEFSPLAKHIRIFLITTTTLFCPAVARSLACPSGFRMFQGGCRTQQSKRQQRQEESIVGVTSEILLLRIMIVVVVPVKVEVAVVASSSSSFSFAS